MQAGELPTLFKDQDRLGTRRVLRMPDFVSDQQVILIHGHVLEPRQHQLAGLDIEHRRRHVRMRHVDILTGE